MDSGVSHAHILGHSEVTLYFYLKSLHLYVYVLGYCLLKCNIHTEKGTDDQGTDHEVSQSRHICVTGTQINTQNILTLTPRAAVTLTTNTSG